MCVNIVFSSIALFPKNGTLWFNTTTEILFEWSTSSLLWVESTPIAVATLNDPKGCSASNIVFTTSNAGSSGAVLIGDTTSTENLTTFVITSFTTTGTLCDALSD